METVVLSELQEQLEFVGVPGGHRSKCRDTYILLHDLRHTSICVAETLSSVMTAKSLSRCRQMRFREVRPVRRWGPNARAR